MKQSARETILAEDTHVFARLLDHPCPNVVRADGTQLTLDGGRRILDSCSGGSITCLGHGNAQVIEAAAPQALELAALPGFSPPATFWRGLDKRRRQCGFLIYCDEIVSGMGRVGIWLATDDLPLVPDIVTIGKGLRASYVPIAAVLRVEHVYDAIDAGFGEVDHGHTWHGAPLPCHVITSAVIDELVSRELAERVRVRGPRPLEQLQDALRHLSSIRDVRGCGFLLGIELVDPRDVGSLLTPTVDTEVLVSGLALANDLLLVATSTASDGYVGDQVVLAPAFTSSDHELELMVSRTGVGA